MGLAQESEGACDHLKRSFGKSSLGDEYDWRTQFATVVLRELLRTKGDALDCRHDMGDFWEHAVVVE